MKYKIGQPLVCYRYDDDNVITPILGCIVDTYKDTYTNIYYVDWSDGEDDCYTEHMIKGYVERANNPPSSNT